MVGGYADNRFAGITATVVYFEKECRERCSEAFIGKKRGIHFTLGYPIRHEAALRGRLANIGKKQDT